jgi:hypothetical protein
VKTGKVQRSYMHKQLKKFFWPEIQVSGIQSLLDQSEHEA